MIRNWKFLSAGFLLLLLTIGTYVNVFAFDGTFEGEGQKSEMFSTTNTLRFNTPKNVRFASFSFNAVPQGFTAYAPDGFQSSLPFTPFSQVTDWGTMLGANPQDTAMQLIGRNVVSVTVTLSRTDNVYFGWSDYVAPTNTPTATPTATATQISTQTATPTATPTATQTAMPTSTPLATNTPVPTITPTKTLTTTWEWVILPGDTAALVTSTIGVTNTHAFYAVDTKARFVGHFKFQTVGSVVCVMYVPDQFAQQYPNATRFSDVKDWSFDTMFGATSNDSLPQLVCNFGKSASAVVLKTMNDIILIASRLRSLFLPLIAR